MESTPIRSWSLRIAASILIYWVICLAALAVVSPYASQNTGFLWAPWTFLVIGVVALPMDVADGFGADPVHVMLFLGGFAFLLAALLRHKLAWVALPGLCCLGLLGAMIFGPGIG